MNSDRVKFSEIELELPPGWVVVTDELPEGAPPTLAKTDGLGALQFSVATPGAGPRPTVELEDLEDLLRNFADNQGFDEPLIEIHPGKTKLVSADFRGDEDFLRVWYGSDGTNVMLVTYFSAAPEDERLPDEVSEAEAIVSSVAFT